MGKGQTCFRGAVRKKMKKYSEKKKRVGHFYQMDMCRVSGCLVLFVVSMGKLGQNVWKHGKPSHKSRLGSEVVGKW